MKNAKTNGGGQLTAENIRRITEKNPFAKLGDVIYELIENAILSSAMGPGERINLSKLSEQLGVSTTPVRDALDRLCAKGIVVKKTSEHSKYASYFVFDISNDSISDLYDARKSIECISAAICAQRNWCVDMSQLDRIASDFKKKMDDYAERKVMEISSPSLFSGPAVSQADNILHKKRIPDRDVLLAGEILGLCVHTKRRVPETRTQFCGPVCNLLTAFRYNKCNKAGLSRNGQVAYGEAH